MPECPCASPHGPLPPTAPSSNPPRQGAPYVYVGYKVTHWSRGAQSAAALVLLPQVRPPLARQPLGLGLPPRLDVGMVPRAKHLGHHVAPILGGPGIARRTEQPVVMRVRAG